MRMFVPTVGTRIRTLADWHFDLAQENRNWHLLCVMHGWPIQSTWERYRAFSDVHGRYDDAWQDFQTKSHPVMLPAGTLLEIDRIYVRKKLGDFDSISFWIRDCPNKALAPKKAKGTYPGKTPRFWVPRQVANALDFDLIVDPV